MPELVFITNTSNASIVLNLKSSRPKMACVDTHICPVRGESALSTCLENLDEIGSQHCTIDKLQSSAMSSFYKIAIFMNTPRSGRGNAQSSHSSSAMAVVCDGDGW